MHEASAVRAAVDAALSVAITEGVPTEVRLSVGGHLVPGQIAGLFGLFAEGTALEGAAVVATRDESLRDELRVDAVVVSRKGSA